MPRPGPFPPFYVRKGDANCTVARGYSRAGGRMGTYFPTPDSKEEGGVVESACVPNKNLEGAIFGTGSASFCARTP